MPGSPLLRIVVDTNVVFEGLTKQGGASGLIIEAWLAGLMVGAMNADAVVVTSNVRDFRSAAESLGLRVLTPVQFVSVLASGEKL